MTLADELLRDMTWEEKIGQLSIIDYRKGVDYLSENFIGGVINVTGEKARQLQQNYVERSRLKIPLLVTLDCVNGHSFQRGSTTFPIQLALAATWNPDLVHEVGSTTANEMYVSYVDLTYAPVLDLSRDLRWGRTGETYGESKFLTAELGSAFVRGIQSTSQIGACAKHFLGYSDSIGARDAADVDVSELYIQSKLLPPFQAVVENDCRAMMLGYHSLNGTPCTVNSYIIEDLGRRQLNFSGVFITDWQNTDRLIDEHSIFSDDVSVTRSFLATEADMQMGSTRFVEAAKKIKQFDDHVNAAIDRSCLRVLKLKEALGLFSRNFNSRPDNSNPLRSEKHKALCLDASRKSLILLENDGLLPLKEQKKIAVVGNHAVDLVSQVGDWSLGFRGDQEWMSSSEQYTRGFVHLLDGLSSLGDSNFEVSYFEQQEILSNSACLSKFTTVLLCVGEYREEIGEMRDSALLQLNQQHRDLVKILGAQDINLVVVYIGSKPRDFQLLKENCNAFVCAFNPGMYGGQALAEALSGKTNFSGRLPITIPHTVGQLPMRHDISKVWHGEGFYYDLPESTKKPLYPFGYGIGYSKVEQELVSIQVESNQVKLKLRLRNTGKMAQIETVQIYKRPFSGSLAAKCMELCAFDTINLLPSTTDTLEFNIPLSKIVEKCEDIENLQLLIGNSADEDELVEIFLGDRFEKTRHRSTVDQYA
jgi:beta-glucosidase